MPSLLASFVRVLESATGKKIDNTQVVTAAGDVQRQVTVQGDPTDADARCAVLASMPPADAYGVVAREAAPAYDSGIVNVPDSIDVVTGDTIRVLGVLLCNRTTSAKSFSLTNTAGDFYFKDYPLQGKMTVFLPLGRVEMVGAKWSASVADSVNAQLVGDK